LSYVLYNVWFSSGEGVVLKIFCAGSLKKPLDRVAELYMERYGVRVYIEASGSVEAVRKITDLGREADIVAVADYRLIRDFLYSDYTSWYIGFATNELVLAFTSKSRYADELLANPGKWVEILGREGVRWGFSNPNKDPCGYRAVGAVALASLYYNDTSILERLIVSRTNIYYNVSSGTLHVYIPGSLEVYSGNLVIRPKSVDLIALLESGAIDYAFEYRSVAIQHNLSYIELPREINLGDPSYAGFYKRVVVHILVGSDREKALEMSPIVYGVTILSNTRHYSEALEFVKLLLGSEGRSVFESMGQRFLEEFICSGSIPVELRDIVKG